MGDRWYRQMKESNNDKPAAPKRELKADIVTEISNILGEHLKSMNNMTVDDLKKLRTYIQEL